MHLLVWLSRCANKQALRRLKAYALAAVLCNAVIVFHLGMAKPFKGVALVKDKLAKDVPGSRCPRQSLLRLEEARRVYLRGRMSEWKHPHKSGQVSPVVYEMR